MASPVVAVEPAAEPGLVEAVQAGGGRVGDATGADAIVWTNPRDPEGLAGLLAESPARWVQLPFAGIERFVRSGVVDDARVWTCTKGVYGPACAEHALALMLAASRCLQQHARARSWRRGGFGTPERRMAGSTVLIVGTGGIGRSLVPLLRPLGVAAIGVNRSGRPLAGAGRTVASEHLDEVLGEADYVVVAAALTQETEKMFSSPQFEAMRVDAWLVNVARGGLVDTDDLVEALKSGSIGGAALDVTDPEPLPDGHPLWDLDNVLITPHVANTWDMGLPELGAIVERNVRHFAAGEPLEGVVDPALGY
jgi:D-3-phosphoglycerate dehydrogenase